MLWVLAAAVFFGFAARSSAASLDTGKLGPAPVTLTSHFEFLEDPQGALRISDLLAQDGSAGRWQPTTAQGDALNFGVTSSTYWLRLGLRNPEDQLRRYMLEIAYPRLASLEMYQVGPRGVIQRVESGYAIPFERRHYKHRFFVFPLTLDSRAEHQIFLRVRTDNTMEVPAKLWSREAFHEHELDDYMRQSWYFGIAMAMVVFNLLLFIALRDFNYLLYVIFITCIALTLAAVNGLGTQFLWGDSVLLAKTAPMVGMSLALLTLMAFMRRMLGTAILVPRLDALLRLVIVLQALLPLGYLLAYQQAVKPGFILDALTALFILAVGVVCAVKRNRSALFFLAAFTVLCLGGVVMVLRMFSILPANILTTDGMQIGSAIEMLLLAFALADRYNVMRREKELAQSEALKAEHRLVENLKSSERLLEQRVEERTRELSETIVRLQKAQADLVEAEKLASLGVLVTGVAHELNTPIGNALTTASGLQDRVQDLAESISQGTLKRSTLDTFLRHGVGMADLIVRSCQRAAHLILSFKQVAVDQTTEQRREFDLRMLVETNIAAVRPTLGQIQWQIKIDIDEGILCDSYPGPLGQVIVNLVQNAAAHAFPEGNGGSLRIAARRQDALIEMRFIDDGVGMEKAVLAHIFDPFFTTRLGQGGSGLGLSVSRNIAAGVLGGNLRAESEPGQGSCFILNFPCVAPARAGVSLPPQRADQSD